LDAYETVKIRIDKATTEKGFKVVSRIADKQYPIGEKIDQKNVEYHRIQFNPVLPKLSYLINQKEQVI
jgi:hypothetical protein